MAARPAGAAPAFLAAALAGDPARPLLTYYDDATGERTELSAVTLTNWVVKTANLLADGCGLGEGDRAAILLPPHWQSAAVLLGTWTAGLSVELSTEPEPEPDPAGRYEVGFASLDRIGLAPAAEHRFVLGLAPMGLPLREVPAGWQDYAREVLPQSDQLLAYASGPGPYARWVTAAGERAAALGLAAGDRVLVDAGAYPDPLSWLLAPLAAGASVVLCAHPAPGGGPARVATERVTKVL